MYVGHFSGRICLQTTHLVYTHTFQLPSTCTWWPVQFAICKLQSQLLVKLRLRLVRCSFTVCSRGQFGRETRWRRWSLVRLVCLEMSLSEMDQRCKSSFGTFKYCTILWATNWKYSNSCTELYFGQICRRANVPLTFVSHACLLQFCIYTVT